MTSKENKQGLFDSLGRASVMGLHMVSGIIVGCLLGYWLDKCVRNLSCGAPAWALSWASARDSAISGWTRAYCSAKGNRTMQAKSGRNNGPFHWLEKRLWRSGVQDPTIREILCWQISVIALSLLFGAVLWPFHPAGAWILLVWLRSAALRMEFFRLNKICS